jgi:uncharacterized membrane protein YhaH (DUF805 family)
VPGTRRQVTAPRKRFWIYSLVSLAVVVAFFALGFSYVPEANAGQPTLFLGLDEPIGFSAYLAVGADGGALA